MKTLTLLILLSASIVIGSCSEITQVEPDAILACDAIPDSVIERGKNAVAGCHVKYIFVFPFSEEHNWDYTFTKAIPSEYFLANEYLGTRECLICGRKEAFHTETWSERVEK